MPNASPKVSQWNIVCVGNARVGFTLGMYISCCLCVGYPTQTQFLVEYGLYFSFFFGGGGGLYSMSMFRYGKGWVRGRVNCLSYKIGGWGGGG